jgi:CPA1 family monovalent cation:H+ antiporter
VNQFEAFLGLALAAVTIAVAARRRNLPYPIVLLLAGLALTFVPDFPSFQLDPQVVFYVLLPPILFDAAYQTSWRDFWRWKRPIFLLAFGLVIATSAAVAVICNLLIPGMNWATGFVLGAIISPPDAAAATAVTRSLKLPRRMVQILEGESLVNDAAALTVYRFAVAAVVGGTFSFGEAVLSFLWLSLAGIAVGALLGWAFIQILPKVRDVEAEIIATFIVALGTYYAAESIHASGVLATVTAGLILGWSSPSVLSAAGRLRGAAVWETLIFLINLMIFILIGLQMPFVIQSLSDYPWQWLVLWGVSVSFGIMAIRLAWIFPAAYLPRQLFRKIREREPRPKPEQVFLIGWTGLRGVVSLAAALALPLETDAGLPFPYRNLLLLLTFIAITSTLTIQGLTLRPLIRWLKIPEDRSSEQEELAARAEAVEKALEHLVHLGETGKASGPAYERIRNYYVDQLADLWAMQDHSREEATAQPSEFSTVQEQRLWWEAARVMREATIDLRRRGKIGDEALHAIERDIDLLEERIVPREGGMKAPV